MSLSSLLSLFPFPGNVYVILNKAHCGETPRYGAKDSSTNHYVIMMGRTTITLNVQEREETPEDKVIFCFRPCCA